MSPLIIRASVMMRHSELAKNKSASIARVWRENAMAPPPRDQHFRHLDGIPCVAHVLVGEAASTSPEHAMAVD